MISEDQARMRFIVERDGAVGALVFARQARTVYRRAVLKQTQQGGKRHPYHNAYIKSYLFHKEWLYNCEAKIVEHNPGA